MGSPNIFIVGCGRSGTSMTAGLFRNSGIFMGDQLHPGGPENAKGYFEDAKINNLNNRILARYTPKPRVKNGIDYQCDTPANVGGWLSRIPLNVEITATTDEQAEIDQWVRRVPFCYKDTRFCYLIHLWQQNDDSARMVCVFRRPDLVAESILKNCRVEKSLSKFAISVEQAFQVWTLMYQHILNKHADTGRWLFLEYENLLNGQAHDALEAFTEVSIDRNFPDTNLNRSTSNLDIPEETAKVFEQLRTRASIII